MNANFFHLGLDLGSISLKAALLDTSGEIIFSRWMRVAGAPKHALSILLSEIANLYSHAQIANVGITGSGRELMREMASAITINEITAQATACRTLYPNIRTIIEIGGQDAKLIILSEHNNGGVEIRDFRMNELCAAGTGAFLDQQATRLSIPIDEFAGLALAAADPVPIAGRCAVFAKTDMTHHQQEGRSLPDIVAGLNEALVRSYLSNMIRGRAIPRPISFQGGVASNEGLAQAFRKILSLADAEFIIPEHHKVMGAIGAAIIASRSKCEDHAIGIFSLNKTWNPSTTNENNLSVLNHKTISETCKCLKLPTLKTIEPDFKSLGLDGIYLGIDIGSVSVKVVALSANGISFSNYKFSDGRPVETLREILAQLKPNLDNKEICGVGITGSGRHFIGKLLYADAIVNEITAQARAALALYSNADTIIEIGGQDAKFMRIKNGRAEHFAMNRVCAAGTGAFLQEQATRLQVNLEKDFAHKAFESLKPAALGSRCTVFMESDLVSHQQQGQAREDLIAGLAMSVVSNYIDKVIGGHPLGERILFIGGVAQNTAVVASLEKALERPIATSTAGRVSGAIGAAIIAFEQKKEGRYSTSSFVLNETQFKYTQFTCKVCPNHCRITQTADESTKTFGGRCGKWDGTSNPKRPSHISSIQKRFDIAKQETEPPHNIKAQRIQIGIPRALFAFDRLPAWNEYFKALGCKVIISPPTNESLLTEGMKHLVIETCLPVKAFCAHLHWLSSNSDVDFIFVPSFVSTGEDIHKKETVHCPYIQGLATIARPVAGRPLITPIINWRLHPKDEEKQMIACAAGLGISSIDAQIAWQKAKAHLANHRKQLRSEGEEILAKVAKGRIPRSFLILGKDYNICDPALNSRAINIFESMGESVISQDMIADDSGHYSSAYRTMYWSHSKEILAAAEIAARTPNLYPVYITSFGCGPDSFTIRSVRDILGDKPLLLLEVDEHSSSIGMETRIEAFVDSLPKAEGKICHNSRQAIIIPKGLRSVWLPNFSDHSYAFAAAMHALGLKPYLTPLCNDALGKQGASHATAGECHPYSLMLGSYLKVAMNGSDHSDACYYMPESGACRVGLFGSQMRLVADEVGAKLPIYTRIEEIAPSAGYNSRRAAVRAVTTYWEMMRGMDFALQKFYETRAYEISPGSTDRAREYAREILMERILEGQPIEGLKEYHAILDAVKTDKSRPRTKVGITGDYFTRICDNANGDIFRNIEKLGGVVMLPPTMSEFVKYDAYQRPCAMLRHGHVVDAAQALIIRGVVNRRERKIQKIFEGSIDYNIPLDYKNAEKLIAPYTDIKLPAGLAGSVAAILEQVRAGADGILNLITFHCNYGLVISSALASIDKDYPNIPKLTLIFEGLKPTHNRTRLEAFMERVSHHKRG